jgi:hypothetical protein
MHLPVPPRTVRFSDRKWPDKTVLVLEVRSSSSQGSINKGGHFQAGLLGIQPVKDESRTPGKWAFIGSSSGSGTLFRRSASCYPAIHSMAAVDNTFVQFYPTLLEVAKRRALQASARPNNNAARIG